MSDSIAYFEKTRKNEHIFLYSVAGRSSSTAFQRIVNSSNKVWIWGEQHQLIDETISLVRTMKKHNEDAAIKRSLTLLEESFSQNKHTHFYPNAIGNLETNIALINSSISNLLQPQNSEISRFGFKDINPSGIETLKYLGEIYPQGKFIFCFRNPINQWPSVSKLNWFPYSHKLSQFLDEYTRVSNIYLEYASANNIKAFIENNDLRETNKVEKIIEYLHLPTIDWNLIDVTVHTANASRLSSLTQKTILKSAAYKNYKKMQQISQAFYMDMA